MHRTMQQVQNKPSEPLDPQAEAQLLMGMPPSGWKYPPSTATAGATYLRRHLGADAGSLDVEVWLQDARPGGGPWRSGRRRWSAGGGDLG